LPKKKFEKKNRMTQTKSIVVAFLTL